MFQFTPHLKMDNNIINIQLISINSISNKEYQERQV